MRTERTRRLIVSVASWQLLADLVAEVSGEGVSEPMEPLAVATSLCGLPIDRTGRQSGRTSPDATAQLDATSCNQRNRGGCVGRPPGRELGEAAKVLSDGREALAADEPGRDARRHDALEHFAEEMSSSRNRSLRARVNAE
jgi:hypothetical protein